MSINSQPVGGGQSPLVCIGDGTSLASVLSIGLAHLADAESLAAFYSLVAASVPMLLNAAGTYDRRRSAIGTVGVAAINSEGTKTTYSAGIAGLVPAANATDFFTIIGSATKTVRVTRVQLSGFATGAATLPIELLMRSVADTTGTFTNPTAVPHDRNSAAGTAVVAAYTVNPGALGALVGIVRAGQLNLGAPGGAGALVWDFTTRNGQGLVLRGITDNLALNWLGAAVPAGTKLAVDIEWTEE
jgi:hypothetical protein